MLLAYNPISASVCFAAKDLGIPVCVHASRRAKTLEDLVLGGGFGFPTYANQKVDIFVTSEKSFNNVGEFLFKHTPKLILWDLGKFSYEAELDKRIRTIGMSLSAYEYSSTVLCGLSTHELGYNLMENRACIVSVLDYKAPKVAPSPLTYPQPFTPLSQLFKTSKDLPMPAFLQSSEKEAIKTARKHIIEDSYIKEHKITPTTGIPKILLNEKWHEPSFSEVANMVGYPIEAQKKLLTIVEGNENFGIYTMLKDLSYPLWKDLLIRSGANVTNRK